MTERRHLRVLSEPQAERPAQLAFAALAAEDRGADVEPAHGSPDQQLERDLARVRGRLRRSGGIG